MTSEQMHDHAANFHQEFVALVHKYAGKDYTKVHPLLLALMQDQTSVFQPYIWRGQE